ncbi:MAG: DUF2190 family protein [Dehalococcoidia bacterium]|nr:DUF2190 family protein [Dehalococcoidia bacterium]
MKKYIYLSIVLILLLVSIVSCGAPPAPFGATNEVYEDGINLTVAVAGMKSGDPVIVGDRGLHGVANIDTNSDGNLTIDTQGIYDLSVKGVNDANDVAIAIGDPVYYTAADTPKLNAKTSGLLFGYALETVSSGATTTINVLINNSCAQAADDQSIIVVSTRGSDTYGNGSWANPLKTIAAAFALVSENRTEVILEPGTYAEVVTWPTVSGVKLLGLSGQWDTVISAPGTTQVISITPGAQTSTYEAYIENIYIDHGTAGQDGILVDADGVGKKVNLYLKTVGGEADSDSDKFLVVDHGGTGNAVRVYWEGNNGGVDGLIYFDTQDNGDRLFITGVELLGGIQTTADAVTLQIRLKDCILKEGGGAGGNAAQLSVLMSCFDVTGTTFTAADSGDVPTSTCTTLP